MIYSQETLKDLVSGHLGTREQDGYLFFTRFTPRQEKLNTERNQGTKNGSTAGMCLRLYAPAGQISFRYRSCVGSSRNRYHIDVYREKELLQQQPGCTGDEGTLLIDNPLPGEIAVWLPCLAGIGIRDFSAPEGIRPVKKALRLFIAGDSITQGYDADSPSLCWANQITRFLDAECVNQAIGGDVFFAGNLGEDLKPIDPDRIFIAYGTNDWVHTLSIKENAGEYLRTLRGLFPDKSITVLLPIIRLNADDIGKKNEAGFTLAEIRQQLRAVAEENGCGVIDCFSFLPADPALFSDGHLHPNDDGFAYYSEGLRKALED